MAKTRPTCIITGCSLFDVEDSFWMHGDLFEMGDVYIFNATPKSSNEPTSPRQLRINDGADFFTRRDVYVIPKLCATLNPEAERYINAPLGAAR